mgnify:CR=1 FL=1|jgi:hypothetical protein|tara:strand:- start:5334 stop:5543 length:210 start_codon:yes stop_codon:yes gene_type:complete
MKRKPKKSKWYLDIDTWYDLSLWVMIIFTIFSINYEFLMSVNVGWRAILSVAMLLGSTQLTILLQGLKK